MVVTCVMIEVKKEHIEDFKVAAIKNHEGSIREHGCLRFDILHNESDPCRFVFYEVFESDDAIKAHKETAHYKTWRDTVEPWMAIPRKGIRYKSVRPAGDEGYRSALKRMATGI